MKRIERMIKSYMKDVAKEHVDLDTGEINVTTLEEDAIAHFEDWGPLDFPTPDDYSDWAVEVAEEIEGPGENPVVGLL